MKKELIGRKVKGFYFEGGKYKYNGLGYNKKMDAHIGKVGVITDYNSLTHSYEVKLGKHYYYYPSELIEQHLVSDEQPTPAEENPLDSLPMLGEGVLCEVWDAQNKPFNRLVVAKTPNGYLAWSEAEKTEKIKYKVVIYWKNARPIEPVKKYTKEQLEEIIGHKFELI